MSSKIALSFNSSDWVAVGKKEDGAVIKIASMANNCEVEIVVSKDFLSQLVSEILMSVSNPCKDEITNQLALKIVLEKKAQDFANEEGERYYEYCTNPKPIPELITIPKSGPKANPKQEIYSAFADLFN